MSFLNVNHSVTLSFGVLLDTPEIMRKGNFFELSVKEFFMWVEKAAVLVVNGIISTIKEKVSRQKSELEETQFLTSNHLALREIGMEQIFQVLRADLSIHTYALKNG